MNWFDTLFHKRKHLTFIKESGDVERNYSEKSHRDITHGRSTITLARNIFSGKSSQGKIYFRNRIENLYQFFLHGVRQFRGWHWMSICLLCIIGYGIYVMGFASRTERYIQYIQEHPAIFVTEEGYALLRTMRRDYQILAPVVGNPLVPLEPFSSYGNLLENAYQISKSFGKLRALEQSVISGEQWKTTNLLVLAREIFSWMQGNTSRVDALLDAAQPHVPILQDMGIRAFWDNFLKNRETWLTLLGKQGTTRILLLNQNSDELRAGGGFPGTAFIIEFNEGKLMRFQFYDIYALDWHLRGYRPPPEGINKFKSKEYPGKPIEFEIRDANYYPRFSESAIKMDELAKEAGIGSIDLVIGINQKFLEDLVQLVEPISLPGIRIPIDHRNVTPILSMLVEGKKSIEGTPKTTVHLLAEVLLKKLKEQGKMQEALFAFLQDMYMGEFIAGSARPEIQSAIDSLGIFDRWYDKKGDWIYPIFTSISRNKSDRFMERTFEITHENACERTLVFRQKHWFDLVEEARIRSLANTLGLTEKLSTLLPVQGDGDNIHYLRFILPPGTQLLPKSNPGFHVQSPVAEYSVLDGYVTTHPGTTSTLTLQYKLPEGYCDNRTTFFKQPGLRNTRFVVIKHGERVYQKYYE